MFYFFSKNLTRVLKPVFNPSISWRGINIFTISFNKIHIILSPKKNVFLFMVKIKELFFLLIQKYK